MQNTPPKKHKLVTRSWFHPMVTPNGYTQWGFCIGERSEAVNCERSEQEGEEKYGFNGFNGFNEWFQWM